nr:MAG TPA: restriction alleviation protein [Caudoviricetes sp.]
MGKLVEHLMPCAVCGSIPKIHYVYEHGHHYKLFCSKNAVHNSTGEWFANKYKACQDWNRRQQALEEKEKTFGDNLKPCPFCGRKMQFCKDIFKGRDGKKHRRMFFIHEDYNPYEDGYCILDELCTQFSIGAGDANVEKGYIGEYATKWNKRACNDEDAMHEIKQTLLGTIYPLEQTVELLEQRNKELEQENQKLKQMLKKVVDDAERLFMGFAGYNPYEKRLKHEDCEAREYCDYCDRDCDCDGQCKWRYEDDVKKLLGEVK